MQQVLRIGDEIRLTQVVLDLSASARIYNKAGGVSFIRGFEYQEVCFDRPGMPLPENCIVCVSKNITVPGVTSSWFTYRLNDSYRIRPYHIEPAGPYSDGLENWI